MRHEVVAGLIIQANKILLGRRSPTRMAYPNVWDVFGGHMEPGERHSHTLVRELQEELGITPSQWNVVNLSCFPWGTANRKASPKHGRQKSWEKAKAAL